MRNLTLQLIFCSLIILTVLASDSPCKRGEIYLSKRCISCKSFKDENLADEDVEIYTAWNSCPCKRGYIWSHFSKKCESPKIERKDKLSNSAYKQNGTAIQQILNKNIKSLDETTCPNSKGYVLYGQANPTCISCLVMPFTINFGFNQQCYCGPSFFWTGTNCNCGDNYYVDLTILSCSPCYILATSLQQTCTSCLFPYERSAFGCILCSTLDNNGGNISCCAPKYTFDYTLGKCICAKGYAFIGKKCVPCFPYGSDCISCINTFIFDGYNCVPISNGELGLSPLYGCPPGYTYKYDPYSNQILYCACSAAAFYYQIEDSCISCSQTLPVGVNLEDCQQCLPSSGFYRGSVQCIYCPRVGNSDGVATVYGCGCLPYYYWNTNTGRCQCDFAKGYINGEVAGTCFVCNRIANSGYYSTQFACTCASAYIWNPSTFSCDCDFSSPYNIFVGGQCITCYNIIGSTGYAAADKVSCQCLSKYYYWNYGTNICQCSNNQGYITSYYPGYCDSCFALSLSNKYAYNGLANNQQCVCLNGYIWDFEIRQCLCRSGRVISGTTCVPCDSLKLPSGVLVSDCNNCNSGGLFMIQNAVCYYCPNQRGSSSDGILSDACICPLGQIWKYNRGGCVCDYESGYITSIFNNTNYKCVYCPYLVINFQQCLTCGAGPLLWGSYYICTDCSKDPNAIITSDKRCICKPGYSWSEITYPYRCAPSFYGGSYMDLSTQPPKYILCSTTKAPSDCLKCNILQGYVLVSAIDQCISCQTVKNSTGKALINGSCQCKAGFQWNYQTYACNRANCTGGYIYNYTTLACDTCDKLRSIIFNGKCLSCQKDLNSYGYAVKGAAGAAISCSCKPSFTWINGACTKLACNSSTSIWLGDICYKCPVTAFSTGAARNSTCVCTNRYTWKSNITGGECHCNLMTNYINSNNSCMPCPSANNSMGLADGEGGCLCRNNFRWDPSGACLCSFSSIGVSGYLSNGNCILCMTNNDFNYEGTVTNNTCNCKKGFTAVRSAKGAITCQCLSPAVKAQGQCITCPKNGNSTGVYSTFGSCLCINGYIWNPQKNTCVCDASVFAYLTPNGTCFSCINAADPNLSGYVVNGACSCINGFTFATTNTGGSCQCTQLLSPNGICYSCPANSVSDENGGCLCLNSYVWSANTLQCLCDESVSSFILPDGGCFVCTSAQDPNFDGTLTNGMCNCINGFSLNIDSYGVPSCSCQLVVYPNGVCFSCPKNTISLGISDGQGGCLCKNRYTWDPASVSCVCNAAYSIVTPNGICVTCGAVGTYTFINTETSSCACASGLTQNYDYAMCDCGASSALLVIGNSYTCLLCDQTVGSNGTKLNPYTCGCISTAFKWNNVTGKCDCGPDATDNNGVCIDCTSISFAAGNNPDIAGTCICNFQGSIWSASDSKCICSDSNSIVFMIGKGQYACQACNPSISAASPRLSPTSCTCPTGTFWSDNVGCVCTYSNSAAFYNGNSVTCIVCDGTINAAGVAAGGRNCICMGTLEWNPSTLSCGCNSTSAIASINGRLFCVNCLSLEWANTPVIGLTNCTCISPKLIWYLQGYCGCPKSSVTVPVGTSSQVVTVPNITCVTCNMSIYSIGKEYPTSNTCTCASSSLIFRNGVCDCDGQSVVMVYKDDYFYPGFVEYYCVNCFAGSYTNGKYNITTCSCFYSALVYNSTQGQCRCKDSMAILFNSSCVPCKGQYVSRPNSISSCLCFGNGLTFEPSINGGRCSCPTGNILLPDITCFECPNGALTPYQCLCPTDSIWNIFSMACFICGSYIPNSQATGGSSLACKCSSGFIWDVMTLSCIVPCTANNASCMDCSMQQAKGTAFPLNATAALKLTGWNITLSAINGAFTNYNSIKGYQCSCMMGFSWDSVRLHCYDSRHI